ncbi:hypothetical protein [Streptomyces sp. NPDC004284]|uniref:hypothetical protein n=1 Tax=Streptomyces sp. NPDC004284 TaxID=3364695 RepID=UPI0036B89BDB
MSGPTGADSSPGPGPARSPGLNPSPGAVGAIRSRPVESLAVEPDVLDAPDVPGVESAWSARFVRLGAPRPGPAARRARWFGVPLVPLMTAALVAGAFLTAQGGAEGGGLADGRSGGDPVGVPSPVVTSGTGPAVPAPTTGAGTADTPGAGTPTDTTTTGGTPTSTAPEGRTGRPQGSTAPVHTGRSAGATPSGRPEGDRLPERSVPFDALRVGDCFDIDRDAPGTALRRGCDTPHRAELVARPRLVGTFAADEAVREAATLLCREPLRRKAARQPLGTRWTTFVQYPYRTSHLLGADTVACSLATTGGTLSHRLL